MLRSRMIRALALFLVLAAVPGCSRLNRPGGDLAIRSLETPAAFIPQVRTACYRRIDSGSADLYFSDVAEGRLSDAGDDLADISGSILHIHFFLEPSPGNTPIDDTACNATVHHVIFAPGAGAAGASTQVFGVYGGGGFFFPSGSIGDEVFGGSMRDGTHRLIAASPGFKDALGPAAIEGSLRAVRDDGLSREIEARIDGFVRRTAAAPAPPAASK